MENVSKALLMAGAVLLGIIIYSTYMFVNAQMADYTINQQDEELIEEIRKFNLQYESYNRQLLYGADVLSIINKVMDYNKQEQTKFQRAGKIDIIIKNNNKYFLSMKDSKISSIENLSEIAKFSSVLNINMPDSSFQSQIEQLNQECKKYINDVIENLIENNKNKDIYTKDKVNAIQKEIKGFNIKIYECVNMEFNNNHGLISKIEFKEKQNSK